MNYEMLTGPYAGEVVEEGPILGGGWESLDEDMKQRLTDWAGGDLPQDEGELDSLVESWENSWESKESDKPITLQTPVVFEE